MDIIIFLIVTILFVLEIIYTFKNHINQTVIACCLVFFIFFALSVIRDIPIPYEGLPESEFSSEVAFFIGKIFYYIGRCIYLIILVIISSIPIFKYKKDKPDDSKNKVKIKCKVCGKTIPYNENETCEECHQKILKRIAEKNNNTEKVNEQSFKEDEDLEKIEIINKSSLSESAKNKLKAQINSISKKDIEDIIKLSENNKEEKNFCTNCGKEIELDWKFCKHCGKEIN